jgi:uncharacterized protein (UPF0332 family)
MSYEKLLSEGRIKRQSPKPDAIHDLLSLAERDAKVAEQTLEVDTDWAFNIAYNSVLQASRAYMLREGYRPRGPNQHATVVRFLKEAFAQKFPEDIATFDQMRRKRHRAVYDAAGRIGAAEAKQASTFAQKYLAQIRELLA